MPLHIQQTSQESDVDPSFGSSLASTIAPTAPCPDGEQHHNVVFQLVHDELFLDGKARQNPATFCQT
jgi:glutamate decarboxylase